MVDGLMPVYVEPKWHRKAKRLARRHGMSIKGTVQKGLDCIEAEDKAKRQAAKSAVQPSFSVLGTVT